MTRTAAIGISLAGMVLLLARSPGLAQVSMRDPGKPEAPVIAVSAAGVEIAGADRAVIPWDRVAAVEGDLADQAKRFASIADRAWRARTRLERSDVAFAEPLFDELLLERLPGPTGAVIARGALVCRLERGALASAVAPWIDAVALRAFTTSLPESSPLARIMDPADALAPLLPPIFLNDESALYLIEHPVDARDDPHASALASLYVAAARAARRSASTSLPPIDADVLAVPAVSFVHAVVAAQIGDVSERAAAQTALRSVIFRESGTFREAWARVAIARSLSIEGDRASEREAVLHYFHLPARFGRSQPYLTGIALAEASRILERSDDPDAANVLRNELAASMPRHPALAALNRPAPPPPQPHAPERRP